MGCTKAIQLLQWILFPGGGCVKFYLCERIEKENRHFMMYCRLIITVTFLSKVQVKLMDTIRKETKPTFHILNVFLCITPALSNIPGRLVFDCLESK